MQEEIRPTTFADEVARVPGGKSLQMCYACGTCVSRCIIPWRDPAYNPRRVFHKVILGMRHEVFEDMTLWNCTACDLCYPACPQQIHISEVIGALRQLALEAGTPLPWRPSPWTLSSVPAVETAWRSVRTMRFI